MFERLKDKVMQGLPSRRPAVLTVQGAGRDGIHTSAAGVEKLRPWSDVSSVHACVRDGFIGNQLTLLIAFASDGLIGLVSEHDPNWEGFVQAVSANLKNVPVYANWSLRVIASPEKALKLFDVAPGDCPEGSNK